MTNPDIITVDEGNFDYHVVVYSDNVPVLVDFRADWSDASQRISPVLEGLANQLAGRFRLAILNVDQNQKIAARFQINSIPTLTIFENGQVIHQMSGSKTTLQVVDFVKRSFPGPGNIALEKATSKYLKQDFAGVEESLEALASQEPEYPRGQLLLLKSYLRQGNILDAQTLLEHFPASPESQAAERLQPLVKELFSSQELGLKTTFEGDAVYYRALKLVVKNNLPAALDGLLGILKKDKNHRGNITRELVIAILELMDDSSPLTKEYRQQLANILF
jgi:putative thioredoxin